MVAATPRNSRRNAVLRSGAVSMAHPRRFTTGTGSSTACPPSTGSMGALTMSPAHYRAHGSRGEPLNDPAAALRLVEHEPQPVVQPVPAALPELHGQRHHAVATPDG